MQQIVQIGKYSYYQNKIVGHGATGSVYLGYRNNDKKPVAVKAIRLSEINTSVKKHLLDCEVAALTKVKNRYVCQAFDVLKDGEFYFIPMEYCPSGTLRDFIKSKVKMSETESLTMFDKILQGYCAIRQAGFIHRDLKSENILLKANMEPLIIDFGYCQKVETQSQCLSYNVGSPAYMSPEAYNDSFYSENSDIWALGIILHEMLTGTIPIMRTNDVNEYFKYLKSMKTAEIIKGTQNPLLIKILNSALAVDSRLRYNAQQLRELINNESNVSSPFRRPNSMSSYTLEEMPQRAPMMQKVQSNSQQQKKMPENYNLVRSQTKIGSENNTYGKQQNKNKEYSNIPSSKNKSSGNVESPTLNFEPVRYTVTNSSNFGNLRKRIQTNDQLNLNMTPIRTSYQNVNQNSNIAYQKQLFVNEPLSANLLPLNRILSNGESNRPFSSPQKIRKVTSSQNINLGIRQY